LQKVGKTFGGVQFEVPETYDLIEALQKRPVNLFDVALGATLAFQVRFFSLSFLLLVAPQGRHFLLPTWLNLT